MPPIALAIVCPPGKYLVSGHPRSEYENNPATSIPETKTIVLYGSAIKSETKRVLIHELAHFLYESLSQEERRSYWRASEWFQVNINQPPISILTHFSEEDGARGTDEDFANNVEHFFEEHDKLKKDFKDIYSWLEKFFGGKK